MVLLVILVNSRTHNHPQPPTMTEKYQKKLDSLTSRYNDNIASISSFTSEITALCSNYNERTSSISTEISAIDGKLADCKKSMKSNEILLAITNRQLAEIPKNMNDSIAREESIYKAEIARITAKTTDNATDLAIKLEILNTEQSNLQAKLEHHGEFLQNNKTDNEATLVLKNTWRSSIREQVSVIKRNKQLSTTNTNTNELDALYRELADIVALIESKKNAKTQASAKYHDLQNSVESDNTKMSLVNSKIADLIAGNIDPVDDFDIALEILNQQNIRITLRITEITKQPEYNINSLLDKIDGEIEQLNNMVDILHYKIQYFQEIPTSPEPPAPSAPQQSSDSLLHLLKLRKEHKSAHSETLAKLADISNNLELLYKWNSANSEKLSIEYERATIRWNTMKERIKAESQDSGNDLKSSISQLKKANDVLNSQRLKLENTKSSLMTKLKNDLDSTNSAKLDTLRNSIIKVEQQNIVITKEMEILKSYL